jgi:hypothetical protein
MSIFAAKLQVKVFGWLRLHVLELWVIRPCRLSK